MLSPMPSATNTREKCLLISRFVRPYFFKRKDLGCLVRSLAFNEVRFHYVGTTSRYLLPPSLIFLLRPLLDTSSIEQLSPLLQYPVS